MVDGQLRPNRVIATALLDAMAEVPREDFVPKAAKGIAYMDEDLPVGGGRFLIDPLTLARLIQAAAPGRHDTVLDIGGATGYSTAVLSRLAGSVVAIEQDDQMVDRARNALQGVGVENVEVHVGPLADGYAKRAPYHVILIDGAVDQVPDKLLAQLAEGGRLATVVGTGPVGRATLITKRRGIPSSQILFDAAVPALKDFAKEPGFVF
jgi:protein-L-isoaspartate(D-aspartate) O-methyltransferase